MKVVIVGAGFGGVGAAIELRKHGIRDVTILDAAPELGGTWFHNTYPGAACDVPSHLYSYSFAQRTNWTRLCSPQVEILDYIRDVARGFGVVDLLVSNARVTRCAFDEASCRWTVQTSDGQAYDADAVILATGQLHQPAWPRIRGFETFTGHAFHSAEWDHDYDLAGKRVAVVGTGASAVQFVPEIAPAVAKLTIFQRSGNWFLPRKSRPYSRAFRALVRWVPGVQAGRRRYLFHYGELLTRMIRSPRTLGKAGRLNSALFMRRQLRGRPDLRAKVWPDYTFGCKRVLFSSLWLPALRRPNVELVTEAVTGVTATGVQSADGTHHEVDCIIWGTGFKTNDFMFPMDIEGAGGRSLAEAWGSGAHAHLGMTVPGFPSMFVMYGPNTNTSGGSIIWYLEQQASYIRQALELVRENGGGAIDVLPEVEALSDRQTQAAFAGTAWTQCDSWYRDESGRIVANWPLLMADYGKRVERIDPAEFRLLTPRIAAEPVV
jgi:cation diffusion facilitator CzcD-associated flavoprotein CzcO